MRLQLIPVQPTSTVKNRAFVDGYDEKTGRHWGELREIESAVYPPEPRGRALRDLRVGLLISLRAAADLLGLSPVELSGLELGKYTLSDADWEAAANHTMAFAAGREPAKEER